MPDVGNKGPYAVGDNIDVQLTILDTDNVSPLDLTGKGVTFVLLEAGRRVVKRNIAAGGSSAEVTDVNPLTGRADAHLAAADVVAPGTWPFAVHVTFSPNQVKTPIWGRLVLVNTEAP